ncbi:MAG: hypothetical protein ACUVWP_06715 [bacterium]
MIILRSIVISFLLFPLTLILAVDNYGSLYIPKNKYLSPVSNNVEFDIKVLNSFECPYANMIMEIDYIERENLLYFVSNMDNKVFICDPDNGTFRGEFLLTYLEDPSPFGLAIFYKSPYTYLHINDMKDARIWWCKGNPGSWNYYDNQAGGSGRGMDYYEPYIWETFDRTGIYSFYPDGSGHRFYYIEGIPSNTQMTGLACFTFGGKMWLVVTTYFSYYFYFYEFDGAKINYMGRAPCPDTCVRSIGLEYAEGRGTFFWSCQKSGSSFKIYELSITIDTVIESSSIGEIRALYK